MQRWHEDYRVTVREWGKHRRSHVERNMQSAALRVGLDPHEVECFCDKQVGRFRKKDHLDCGKTRCLLCHSDKYPRRTLHNQEVSSDLALREQIRELGES